MPEVSLKPLEKLFQAKLIAFLVKKTLLPPERARMLQSWKHSGFRWYSNKMRGQRNKQAAAEAKAGAVHAAEVIDVSGLKGYG